MDWWQLIDFDNPDNEFRVVRNLYRSVSVSRITLRWKRYPQETLQIVASVGHNPPFDTTMMKAVGYDSTVVITQLKSFQSQYNNVTGRTQLVLEIRLT